MYMGVSGSQLQAKLKRRGLVPRFGIHGIYELARTFLQKEGREKGISLFQVLRDLDPSYQPTVNMILEQEIIKLRTGAAVLPILDPLNRAATKQEVEKLARGIFDERAKAFISKREAGIKINHPLISKANIQKVINGKKKPSTFEQFLTELEPEFPDLIYRMLNKKVTLLEARELNLRLKSFPAIRTTAMGNAYMASICIIHGAIPGKDKNDDYRHLIEASYCDVFITSDSQLIKTTSRINPDIEVMECDDLLK
jgi:hypothetical protein